MLARGSDSGDTALFKLPDLQCRLGGFEPIRRIGRNGNEDAAGDSTVLPVFATQRTLQMCVQAALVHGVAEFRGC